MRTLIARDLDEAYRSVDVLVSPATPTTAFPLGEKVDDPLAMYLFDLCTLPLNLAATAACRCPRGCPRRRAAVGLQIMAPALADDRLYRVGAAYEAARARCPRRFRSHLGATWGTSRLREQTRNRTARTPRVRFRVCSRPEPAAGQDDGMRIGLLTGGGDCPGLNAVIRAVVRTCDARYGSSVVGFQDGWRGLLENRPHAAAQRRPERPAAGQGRNDAGHRARAP
ncbi:phosphofructokinase family protein, partial [Mycobacterium kansasii 662]